MSFGFGDLIAGLRAGVFLKSVQTGTISFDGITLTGGTATITSVNTARAFVLFNGWTAVGSPVFAGQEFPYVSLTNATTVTATRGTTLANSGTITVAYTVVEFF